ncbi:pseudouridine synthase [Pararhizobium qamdonense]|uniref:pseudouridine synthase n=1 Tax=Pararhizobium qamdonense TaxID=3031126 RepID=UPI0023E0BB32|nr:pseudouridine synthase [Pararhizobium qamdonense]
MARQASDTGARATICRALSKLGYCSRTQAEKLVAERRVTLGGRVVSDILTWADIRTDIIAVDGIRLVAQSSVYLMLNKPRGMVTTRVDPEGRPTVFDCLAQMDNPFLSPVGRLDKASEGLLLFTNDTVLAQRLLDPVTNVGKIYHVQVKGIAVDSVIAQMRRGVCEGGEMLKASSVRMLRSGDRNTWIEVELREGRYRQIRRMLKGLDMECLRLIRVAIDDIKLGDLAKGSARPLDRHEIEILRRRTQITA